MGMVMAAVLACAAFAQTPEKDDPIKSLVLGFVASYIGIATGVALLVEGLKIMFTDRIKGKENHLVFLLTWCFGALAKWLMPAVYGPIDRKSWVLHMVILVFVAIIGMLFHDKFIALVKSLLGKKVAPAVGGDGGAPGAGGGA
jgi:hypothetical protein